MINSYSIIRKLFTSLPLFDFPSVVNQDSFSVTAFGGAIRLFGTTGDESIPSISKWNQSNGWLAAYPKIGMIIDQKNLTIFMESAFGNQYLVDESNTVYVFYPDEYNIYCLNCSLGVFFKTIASNPSNTIDLDFYKECVDFCGSITGAQFFAFTVPLIVGGKKEVANATRIKRYEYLHEISRVVSQVAEDLPGSKYVPTKK
jgi:hypothetical protein